MILYRIGEVIYKNNSNIIFESQGVGYSAIMPDSSRVEPKQKLKLYFYEIKNDYYQATYVFKDFKERLLFIDLLNLNGIGPKMAYNILNQGFEKIAAYIASGDSDSLLETPYINAKSVRLIIAELQTKWNKILNPKEVKNITEQKSLLDETKETLKMLGFKSKQIEQALNSIEPVNNVEAMIEEAIKFISSKNTYESNPA